MLFQAYLWDTGEVMRPLDADHGERQALGGLIVGLKSESLTE
jgi:hypothetical protein